jgi:hypothetical protein
MKPSNLKYIWIIQDEYGDVSTEFYYPEKDAGQIPNTMEKDMNYMNRGHKCKAIRLKVEVTENLHTESK